jgi:hypothetical protein
MNLKLLKEFEGREHQLYALDKADVNKSEDGVHQVVA